VADIMGVEMSREERFRVLFDLHFHRVLGYALRRTSRPADAEDVVAEVFTVAWRRLDDIPVGRAARAWLYEVARRILANQRRGVARRARLVERLNLEASRLKPADAADVSERAASAFAELRTTDRELLALHHWEGLSAGEIAAVLGISASGARVKLHRARRRFAEALEAAERASFERNDPSGIKTVETEEA
jgi:RNA polymerase sigma-70 factor (ECF subfamily)